MAAHRLFIGADTGNGYEHFMEELRPRGENARVCVLRGAIGTERHLILERLAQDWQRRGRAVTCYADAGDAGALPQCERCGHVKHFVNLRAGGLRNAPARVGGKCVHIPAAAF